MSAAKSSFKNGAFVLLFLAGFLSLWSGCSGEKSEREQQPASRLTESQRDSVIARSKLPGAGVVGRARALSDSAEARAKRLDEGRP